MMLKYFLMALNCPEMKLMIYPCLNLNSLMIKQFNDLSLIQRWYKRQVLLKLWVLSYVKLEYNRVIS